MCELVLPQNNRRTKPFMAREIFKSPIICWLDCLDFFSSDFYARVRNNNSQTVFIELGVACILHFYRFMLNFVYDRKRSTIACYKKALCKTTRTIDSAEER